MGTGSVGFESQPGLLRHLSHKVLWVVTDIETTQSHHFHESVGGLFYGTLVFLGCFWRHVYLVVGGVIHQLTTQHMTRRHTPLV
jgi:hypothetical protein